MSRFPDPTSATGGTGVTIPGAYKTRSSKFMGGTQTAAPFSGSPLHNPPTQQLRNQQVIPQRQQTSPVKTDIVRSRSRKHSNENYLMYIPPTPDTGTTAQSTSHSDHLSHIHRHQQQPSDASQRSYTTARQISGPSTTRNTSAYNTPATTTSSEITRPTSSYCATCHKPITTKSVKALGKRYHTQCFGCSDCGTPILSKYFPFETEDGKKIPLCEEHFYKRRGLVCCVCDNFLKGTHYTVFGRKYDAEHFCCKICSKKFDTDEDFFNHENNIYCHYHFSKFFIERCEGCEFAILKQYVEIFRGGRNQKWHVECYMIHKCWNVAISPTTIGLSSFPRVDPTEVNIKSIPDVNPTPDELLVMESRAAEKISDIWTSLFKFEEDTATCISDMLLSATAHDQRKGLSATARLVLKIDALFRSIESLHRLGIDAGNLDGSLSNLSISNNEDVTFQSLRKEPRNLSAKIMIYLAILRKTSKGGAEDTAKSQDLILSVVTGLAHYLKLLIRYGLHNSLQYNKTSHTTNALDKFLREMRNHESVPVDALDSLNIPVDASDLCFHCQKSIESECVQYQDKRWHIDCLHCTKCHKNLQAYGGVGDASFNSQTDWVLCAQCAMDDPNAKSGFRSVSKLLQLSYLLKIAIVRSRAVMEYEYSCKTTQETLTAKQNSLTSEQGYMKTLNDIKRLRSTRQNTRITESSARDVARRSVIIESSEYHEDQARQDNRLLSDGIISKQKITVEDEPVGPSLSKKSFNRATTFMNNQKVLTLDDIPRIVAAEHARELRPNTYKFHNPHQDEGIPKNIKPKSNSIRNGTPSVKSGVGEKDPPSSKYYCQLTEDERYVIAHISALVLREMIQKFKINTEVDVNKLLDIKKNPTFWDKLKGLGNNEKRGMSLGKVFGSDLKELTAKTGVESGQSNGPSKVRIPMLIEDLLTALYQKDMSVEGVFRKNGNLKTLRELVEKIDSNPNRVPDLEAENTIQLSALLKKFLREMPNPLLTFRLYDIWILSQKVRDTYQKRILTELSYSMLPKDHRDLTEVLLFFFMWASSFSHLDDQNGSKMDVHNLATVLSPNVLYAKPSEVSRPANGKGGVTANTYYDAFGENEGENYYLAIEVIDYLIAHGEELSLVPTYLVEIFEKCQFDKNVQYTSKEIFMRVETFLKQRPDFLNEIGKDDPNDDQQNGNMSMIEEKPQGQTPVHTMIN